MKEKEALRHLKELQRSYMKVNQTLGKHYIQALQIAIDKIQPPEQHKEVIAENQINMFN